MSYETYYPQDEVALNEEINKLMTEWEKPLPQYMAFRCAG